MNLEALKIISQVIHSPGIQHPRKVDGVGGGRVGGAGVMIRIIALAAVVGFMAPVLANLAPGTPAVATPTASAVVAGVAPSTLPAIAGITSVAVVPAGVAAITALAALPWLAMSISRAPPPLGRDRGRSRARVRPRRTSPTGSRRSRRETTPPPHSTVLAAPQMTEPMSKNWSRAWVRYSGPRRR